MTDCRFQKGSSTGRLRSIDVLRGSAALAVVLTHTIPYDNASPLNVAWFRSLCAVIYYAWLAVPLFFVISGFCIHLHWAQQYSESGKSQISFTRFWKRRIHRLYPPYFVVLCLSMALVVLAYLLRRNVDLVNAYPDPKPTWLAADFVAHVLMLHGLHPTFDHGAGNPPFWTLAREEYFYIMYFALLAWRRPMGLGRSLAVVLALGPVFRWIMSAFLPAGSGWWPVVESSAIVLWIQWCLGMVAAEAYCGLVRLPGWCSCCWLCPVWAFIAAGSARYCPWLSPFLWGMTFFTLLNYCIRLEQSGKWPRHAVIRWLAYVGTFSYSLYLVHQPVRAVLRQIMGPALATHDPWRYTLNGLCIVAVSCLMAWVFFTLVEARYLNRKPVAGAVPSIASSSSVGTTA